MKIYTIYYFILIAILFCSIQYNLNNMKKRERKTDRNLNKQTKDKEGFKAFDSCKNSGYPFKFCIDIPFNSETIYKSWEELEDTTRY